jgi:hypothetical protein
MDAGGSSVVVVSSLGASFGSNADVITRKCVAPDIALETRIRPVCAARWIPPSMSLPIIVSDLRTGFRAYTDVIVGPCLAPNVARQASGGTGRLGGSFQLF